MSRTLSKFCLPFDQATPAVHFLKAIKCPRNNTGLASNDNIDNDYKMRAITQRGELEHEQIY